MLINFKNPPQRAFIQAIIKGMAAPTMLFGQFSFTPQLPEIDLPPYDNANIQGVWEAVGADIHRALGQHAEQAIERH